MNTFDSCHRERHILETVWAWARFGVRARRGNRRKTFCGFDDRYYYSLVKTLKIKNRHFETRYS